LEPKKISYVRLVKSEDLNHHGTLFAGRCAEWFVEAGFIAVASVLPAQNIVCLKIHGLEFSYPLRLGQIAQFSSKVIYTGKTSIKVYVELTPVDEHSTAVSGFITFVYIDEDGKPTPHELMLELSKEVDLDLNKIAKELN
jgi:acyl-CoA hydrolase